MRYAHTLLFECPDCQLPVAITRVSYEKSLEDIDGLALEMTCSYCLAESKVLAVAAKQHYVADWPSLASTK